MRGRLLTTSHGTNREAFTGVDWALFLSLGLIWGSSFLLMAIGLDAFHPGVVTWLRLTFGALVLALIPQVHRNRIQPEDRGRVGFLGFIWLALPLTLFPIAQQWIDSATAGMINGATPLFTALIATLLLRALPGRLQIIGLIIGFTGIVAIAIPSAGSGTTEAIGVVLILTATVCYGVSLNLLPPLQQKYGALTMMARAQWVAALMVTPFGLYGLTQSSFEWASMLAVLTVGVVGTGLAFVLMSSLSGRVGATRSAFTTHLIPVVALILGVVFRDDVVAPIAVVGVILVIAGALLASRREV